MRSTKARRGAAAFAVVLSAQPRACRMRRQQRWQRRQRIGGRQGAGPGKAECAPQEHHDRVRRPHRQAREGLHLRSSRPRTCRRRTRTSCSSPAPAPTVNYEGSKEFEAQLVVRVKSGNPPDIAYRPAAGSAQHPGQTTGKVIEAPESVAANVDKWFGEDWKAYGTVDGKFYAAAAGRQRQVLRLVLAEDVRGQGLDRPDHLGRDDWRCPTRSRPPASSPGARASAPARRPAGRPPTGSRTSCSATTVRTSTTSGSSTRSPSTTRKVAAALDRVGGILKNPKYVNGGFGDVKSIATTTFQDGGLPILDGKCAMHRQASFYAANFPEGTKVAEDGDVFAFYLPTTQRRTTASPFSAAASSSPPSATRPRCRRSRPTCRRTPGPTRRPRRPRAAAGSAPTRVWTSTTWPAPIDQLVGEDPAGPERRVPLRRLRPDAGCRRRRLVLEGADRLDHR